MLLQNLLGSLLESHVLLEAGNGRCLDCLTILARKRESMVRASCLCTVWNEPLLKGTPLLRRPAQVHVEAGAGH